MPGVTTRRGIFAVPVPGDNPAGVDPRSGDDRDVVVAEIQKLSSLNPETIDWQVVESRATSILESQGKDLQVGCYLALALFVNHGYPGLAEALAGLTDMTSRYWDEMFPRKPRARANAVGWMIERLEQRVPNAIASGPDVAAIGEAAVALQELDAVVGGQLPEEAPDVSGLRELLERLATELEQPAAAPPAEAAPTEVAAPAVAAQSATPRPAPPANQAEAFAMVLESLAERGATLFAEDPRDPRSYQWRRIAAWSPMKSLPDLDDRGMTYIGGPDDASGFVEEVGRRETRADWVGLADLCEGRLRGDSYWLDLQFWTHEALTQLGPAFTAAAETVRVETMLLLRRVSGLHELQFRDGTPLASGQTRRWIAADVLSTPGGEATSGRAPRSPAVDEDDGSALAQAEALARDGRAEEALAVLGAAIERASSGRERFRRRLDLIEWLGGQREWRLAGAQVDQLDREMQAVALESWEPLLASDALQVAVSTFRQLARAEGRSVPDAASRADALYGRLARFDPMAALRLGH